MSMYIEQKGTIIYKNSIILILLSKARAKYLPFDDEAIDTNIQLRPENMSTICQKYKTRTIFFFNLLIFFPYLLNR